MSIGRESAEVDAVCYLAQEVPIRAFGHLLAIPKSENETLRALGVGSPERRRVYFYDPKFMQSRADFIHELVRLRKGESGGAGPDQPGDRGP